MSTTFKLPVNGTINWPACCSQCLSEDHLQWNSLTSGRVKSAVPTFTGMKFSTEQQSLHYPVCKKHKRSFWHYIYTRKTLGFQLLRGWVYLVGAMTFSTLASLLLKAVIPRDTSTQTVIKTHITPPPDIADKSPADLVMLAIGLLSVVAFVFLIKTALTCPVKVSGLKKGGFLTITFRNDEFAERFKQANPELFS